MCIYALTVLNYTYSTAFYKKLTKSKQAINL